MNVQSSRDRRGDHLLSRRECPKVHRRLFITPTYPLKGARGTVLVKHLLTFTSFGNPSTTKPRVRKNKYNGHFTNNTGVHLGVDKEDTANPGFKLRLLYSY